ncbi:acetyl esterase/lipase [Breznakibacter xylanolyticus]|uniref:Acetyl esterase/lipase n=1 Tax=Breznakibacter xylanolyticus TaxID=990 RepID=A0A2W7N664_9BACT|nr:alpha/beta hydrolase [Breznakibacter xylanolyticus]PZX15915.1 acetyl esterase/lipase [Breznakibacter xylanolyticus]
MKLLLQLLFLLMLTTAQFAQSQALIPLWGRGEMPNSKGMRLDRIEARERVTQVDVPGIYPFFTSHEENTGAAVLICPPGGYQKLTYQIAGFQLAKWFNTFGVNAFVLMYRMPASPDLMQPHLAPLQDAQRAMQLIRSHAEAWGIHPQRVGVMGCSAGGHLAASLSTWTENVTSVSDTIARQLFLPDFQILVSPVITMGELAHAGSRKALLGASPTAELVSRFSCEKHVTPSTPPAFVVHAQDDATVPVSNSLIYYQALVANSVQASLHLFPAGGHSIALRNNPPTTNLWPQLCEAWMREMGWLTPVK